MKFLVLVPFAVAVLAGTAFAAEPFTAVKTDKGEVLAGEKGMTLYTFKKDKPGTSNCYDKCATNWPPAIAASDAATEGAYSLVTRKDGAKQWAKDGMPLYYWVKDKKEGDTTGDGVNGVWDVAKPDPHGVGMGSGREGASSSPVSFDAEILALLPQLRRYSRSLTRSDAESEDLLQDCVEKALSHRGQWRGANIRAWAYRIMTNLHLNARRAVARRPSVGIEAAESIAEGAPPSDPLARNRLVQALDTLPKEARAVLMLVAVEGHTYQEVAEILDVPAGTVMSRLSRARQMLREKLAAENVIHLRSPR